MPLLSKMYSHLRGDISLFLREWTPILLPAFIIIAIALYEPRFLSSGNILNVLRQNSSLAILTMAQSFPLLTRGLDLSQGGLVVLTSVSIALLSVKYGLMMAYLFGLLLGATTGLFAGVLLSVFRVSPFIVTLGIGSIETGVALLVSNGQPVVDVAPKFSQLYYSTIIGLPLPIIIVISVAIVLSWILNRLVLGSFIRAVGSNPRAAYLAGVPVALSLTIAYMICGILTSLGGILLSSRISSGHPTVGSDFALQAVAAAVIGGVSLFGGQGTVIGTVLGAFFLGLLTNALNLLNISSFSQNVVIGLAIICAVLVDRIRHWNRT